MQASLITRWAFRRLRCDPWHARSWSVIAGVTLLFSGQWLRLPIFLDIYYHLGVMQGFLQAGGIVLQDFWEYAPLGRPHLYPPLLHVLLTALASLGWDPLFIARAVQWLSVPLMYGMLWWAAARLTTPRQAFFTVAVAFVPYSFFLTTVNTLAATLAVLEFLALVISVERGRWVASSLWWALLWYTHLGLPWLFAIGLGINSCWHRERRGIILGSCLIGWLLAGPWLWHVWSHRAFLGPMRSYENVYTELPLSLWIAAAGGAVLAWRQGGRARWPLALWIGLLPMLAQYRYRFLCGQGLLPAIVLGGAWCDWVCRQADARLPRARYVIALLLVVGLWLTPTRVVQDTGARWVPMDSTLTNLWPRSEPGWRTAETNLYHPQLTPDVVESIKQWSAPDEIVGSNQPYTAGMFTVLAGRALSTAMFAEVRPAEPMDPYRAAHLIVWLKHPEQNPEPLLVQLAQQYGWRPVQETALVYLFRNPSTARRVQPARAAVSLPIAWLLAFGALGVACWHTVCGGRNGRTA